MPPRFFGWLPFVPTEEKLATPPPIPDYQLLRLIGRGSYGDVWLARGATGLLRAVKVVWRDRFEDIGPYEREFKGLTDFMRLTQGEARQLALLHVGRNDNEGFFYYVMELADDVETGRQIDPDCYAPLTLRVLRNQSTYVPAADVLRYGIDLAAGLAELHRTGLIHRDIKPSNIILVGGRPKLADVGLVSVATEAMTFVGTEGFVPPEGPGTPAADIYSLGKVLYELATGHDRQDFPSLPPQLAERSDWEEFLELNEVIVKACAPRVRERHDNAEDLLNELRLLEAGKSVRRLRFAEHGLIRARRWIMAAIAVAVVAGGGAFLERRRANVESAGRQAAEAELAELTRRTLHDASLATAQRALETGNYGVAREALERAIPTPGEPDLRGFAWHALYREAKGDPAEIIRAFGDTVTRIEASADGRWVAVDNTLPTIELYDQQTGQHVRTFKGIHRIAGFSPDGQRLIGTTPDYALETWSIEDGNPDGVPAKGGVNRPLFVHPELPRLLYFEDGPGDSDHRLAIWDYSIGQDLVSWPVPQMEDQQRWFFHQADASADLRYVILATTRNINTVSNQYWRIIDMNTGKLAHPGKRVIRAIPVVLSNSGERFMVYDTEFHHGRTLAPSEALKALPVTTTALGVSYSGDDSRIILATYSNQIAEVDAVTGRQIRSLRGSGSQIDGLTYSADESFIWSSDRHGEIRRWPLASVASSPQTIGKFSTPENAGMFQLSIDPSSQYLATGNTAQKFAVWELKTLKQLWYSEHIGEVIWMGSDSMFTINLEGQVLELETATGSVLRSVNIFPDARPLKFAHTSPTGNLWLVDARDETLALWDKRTEQLVTEIDRSSIGMQHSDFFGQAISDQGLVLSIDTHQNLQLWNAYTGQVNQSRSLPDRPVRITLTPQQQHVLIANGATPAKILTFPGLEEVMTIPDGRRNRMEFAFHPRDPIVVTQVIRGSLTLINYLDGTRTTPLELPQHPYATNADHVGHVAFSPNGKTLVTMDGEGNIRAWHRE
jgi:WD40 repeat protein